MTSIYDDLYILVDNGKNQTRFNGSRLKALARAASDTVTMIWLMVGLLPTLYLPFYYVGLTTDGPNTMRALTAFACVYWLCTLPFGIPRLRSGFRIGRNGIIVKGIVIDITGVRGHRLVAQYEYLGKNYSARTGTHMPMPNIGDAVFAAIDPMNPSKYRLVPYDLHVSERTMESLHKSHQ